MTSMAGQRRRPPCAGSSCPPDTGPPLALSPPRRIQPDSASADNPYRLCTSVHHMRYAPIPAHLFAARRQSFMRAMKRNGLAVICSNETAVRTGDQLYPFRQNSDLFRLTGIEQEETILVLCP